MIYQYYDQGLKKSSSFTEKSRVRLLLAYGLYREYGIKKSAIIRNSFGKPMLKENPELFISLSHTKGSSALIISKRRVGIDLEKVRPYRKAAADKVLHENELRELQRKTEKDIAFFQLFTLKESYIKALGCGFSYPVKTLCFHVDDQEIVTSNRPYAIFQTRGDEKGYRLSICRLKGEEDAP